jgi:CBS domain containing-hemolysin-like protein
MYGLLGSVPTQGERVEYGDLTFTAEKVQGRRIAKILIERREPRSEAGPAEPAEVER